MVAWCLDFPFCDMTVHPNTVTMIHRAHTRTCLVLSSHFVQESTNQRCCTQSFLSWGSCPTCPTVVMGLIGGVGDTPFTSPIHIMTATLFQLTLFNGDHNLIFKILKSLFRQCHPAHFEKFHLSTLINSFRHNGSPLTFIYVLTQIISEAYSWMDLLLEFNVAKSVL